MNVFRKLLCIGIAATFVLTALASCANNDDKKPVVTGTNTDPNSGGPVFQEANYDGAEFKFLHYGETADNFHDQYIWSESYSSDVIQSAVVERNKLVEDRYNVKITAEECAPMDEAKKRILAGAVDFNVIYEWGIRSKDAALEGFLYDFHELNYVDFEQSYWVPSAIEGQTVADRMFVASNLISMNPISWAGMYYFNKALMDKLQLDYPYDYVEQDNWTYDVVLDMCLQAEEDVNGDGIWDKNDQYGGIDGSSILSGVCSAPLYEANDDGSYTVITYTDGMAAAYNEYKTKTDSVRNLDAL
ncbi:MAG: hypothetical protein E7578_09515, partial [Ruminococcaceae bacterium]|nr:hypothetical protein [Oscillospiraceae bacterium]